MSARSSFDEDTARQWLLPPSVEDEEAALAQEYNFGNTFERLRDENQPVYNRGTVDQRPIIIDIGPSSFTSPEHNPSEVGRNLVERRPYHGALSGAISRTGSPCELDDYEDDTSNVLSQDWLCGECGKDCLPEIRLGLVCQYCSSINRLPEDV